MKFLLLLTIILEVNTIETCLKDDDCFPQYMCYNGRCSPCFDCSLLYRQKVQSCDNIYNCGDCLPGYEEISTTSSSKHKKPCNKVIKENDLTCIDDDDCLTGYFCSTQKQCSKCFDCSQYKREPPEGSSCAKQFYECGRCLIGYNEIIVAPNATLKPCQSVEFMYMRTGQSSSFSIGILPVTLILVVSIAVIASVLTFLSRKKTNNYDSSQSADEELHSLDPPPPYPSTSNHSEERTATFTYGEEKERESTAIVFQYPTASYYPREVIESNNSNNNHHNHHYHNNNNNNNNNHTNEGEEVEETDGSQVPLNEEVVAPNSNSESANEENLCTSFSMIIVPAEDSLIDPQTIGSTSITASNAVEETSQHEVNASQ